MDIDIAARIRQIRKRSKLTQTEFAERLNCSRDKIVTYELSKINFDNSFLDYICKVFNINYNWLLTGEGDMDISKDFFTLDDYAKKRNATPLEIEIIKGLLDFDEDLREAIINHFKAIFLKHAKSAATQESLSPNEIDKSDEIVKGLKNVH